MNSNVKSVASLIAVLSMICFGSARADTLKQTRSSAIDASQSMAATPIAHSVVGESQDSGLGDLPATYTGAEFQRTSMIVTGAKQDSGLGEICLSRIPEPNSSVWRCLAPSPSRQQRAVEEPLVI